MGIFDGLRRQLRSVIEWEAQDETLLFDLWSRDNDEIKNASKLLVKPSQGVIFLYEGKIQAVHTEPGLYTLGTANIPFLTTISKFMQSFESEHKVAIYFFSLAQSVNRKWGTTGPLKYLDPVYRFPVGLRAFGNFSFSLIDPVPFFTTLVAGRDRVLMEDAARIAVSRFMQPLADTLAHGGYGYTEIDKRREELSQLFKPRLAEVFQQLGLELTDVRIEHTDFDEETNGRVGKIADMIAESEAAKAAGLSYAQLQQLGAMRDAARNEGGLAGVGASIGVAAALAGQMTGPLLGGVQPAEATDPASRLKALKALLEDGLITQEEFEKKREKILAEI